MPRTDKNQMQRPKPYEQLFAQQGIEAFFKKVPWCLTAGLQNKGALKKALSNEAHRLESLKYPTFSLITPLYNTDPTHLQELVWSCFLQTYSHWELLLHDDGSSSKAHLAMAEKLAAEDHRIKFTKADKNQGISAARNAAIAQASGDYVCVLDHDDLIHPQILGVYARLLADDPTTNFLYCNEVKISNDGTALSEFHNKPDFSFATLLRTNFVCHLTAVKRSLLIKAKTSDGLIFIPKYDGFEDHNLFIRIAELPDFKPRHVPVFGYYWRKAATSTAAEVGVKDGVWARGRMMLEEHLGQNISSIAVTKERGGNELHSIHFRDLGTSKVSVVIPFKDRFDLTEICLDALESQDTLSPVTVILVDNNSADAHTASRLSSWLAKPRRHQYMLTRDTGPFNYSAINNAAVRAHCKGADFILFLNNDVKLTSPNALAAMVGEMQQHPRIAVCGLRLDYPDNQGLQHGGMGLRREPSRLLAPRHLDGAREFIHDEHKTFAVTFACALVRKTAFDAVHGFDEVFFANGLSDTDLCCRISRLGFEVFYFGTLRGIHFESATRDTQTEDFEIQLLNERHGGLLQAGYSRQYGYNLTTPAGGAESWLEVPLRYKVADALNDKAKAVLGPLHRSAKKFLKRQ